MKHEHNDGCRVCVICGKHFTEGEHVDTCGERCFRALLAIQREEREQDVNGNVVGKVRIEYS